MGLPDFASKSDQQQIANKERLKQIVVERALQIAKPGEIFTLSSGQESKYYFDLRRLFTGESIILVTDIMVNRLAKVDPFPQRIVVPGRGANMWAAAMVTCSYQLNLPMREATVVIKSSSVRETDVANAKNGLLPHIRVVDDMAILNPPRNNAHIALLDDVTSTGGAIVRTYEKLSQIGKFPVAVVLSILDREMGATENLQELYQAPVFSIFTQSDFAEYLPKL